MAWWHKRVSDLSAQTYELPEIVEAKPGQIIECDAPKKVTKTQTGYEWFEWSHGGKGVPWRINTEEFNQMLMDGWEIVDICNSFTLLNRPTFVHYLESPKRRKK